jgi:polysaccharide transporter, PST family
VAITSYTTAVPLLIGALTSPTTLGLFSAGDRIRAAVQSLLAPIGTAAFPHFSRWMQEDKMRGLGAARRMLGAQVGLALLAYAAIALLSRPVILLLVGESFLDAVPVAQVLGLCIVCTAISNTLGMQVMLALDMDRAFTRVLTVCAVFGLALTAIMAHEWHELGAASAVLTTEALVAGLMALVLWRHGVWRIPKSK